MPTSDCRVVSQVRLGLGELIGGDTGLVVIVDGTAVIGTAPKPSGPHRGRYHFDCPTRPRLAPQFQPPIEDVEVFDKALLFLRAR